MKKLVASILCLVLMITSFALAAEVVERPDFNMFVNGQKVVDVPIVIEGRTLVPLRTLAVALGVPNDNEHIIWNAETREVTVINENIRIELTIDSTAAVVNGENKVIDVPAMVYNGKTYLPARFVAESFEKYVGWDGETGTITISDEPIAVVEPIVNDAAAVLKKSQEAMKDVKSMKANMDMSMDMSMNGMSLTMDMDGVMSVDMNKKQMYGDLDLEISSMQLSMETGIFDHQIVPAEMFMYVDNDNMYLKLILEGLDTGWINASEGSTMKTSDVWALAEQSEQMEMPEEFYDAFENAGVEGNCTVIKTKDELAGILNELVKQIMASSMNQDLAVTTNIDLTDIEYKMYINNSTNYTDKVEMGMAMSGDAEGEAIAMDFSIDMNMSEFNTVKITKPEM